MSKIHRRTFVKDITAAGTGVVVSASLAQQATAQPVAAGEPGKFASAWQNTPDRVWIGAAYWANPLQDWRVSGGRLECVNSAPDRHVHLLTRQLTAEAGTLNMSVEVGTAGGEKLSASPGSAGFRIGISGAVDDYRHALIYGNGLDAGFAPEVGLFIGQAKAGKKPVDMAFLDRASIKLQLSVDCTGEKCRLTLAALDCESGEKLSEVSQMGPAADKLAGNIALVANYPRFNRGGGKSGDRFWFSDWQLSGSKLAVDDDQAFGPILFSQYTLSGGTLKLTAQMPPLGEEDTRTVTLEIEQNGTWKEVGTAEIDPRNCLAKFRLDEWSGGADVPYRLSYEQQPKSGKPETSYFTGTFRRDPVDQQVITVGDVSCNIHAAFPNADYTAKMASLDPDLLAFVGDQFYESSGGYGVQRGPLDKAILDYLRKWYLHGWTWRELMKDRPSVSIPDDHDVYQGNIWGESGAPQTTTQEAGGYQMHPVWVNVVHATQTSHHPDAYDPGPIKQGITSYFGPLTYGRISFAILADRMFKSAPEGNVPPTGGRGDHVRDPNFDPKTADLPGLELLGDSQMKFLSEWVEDWRNADLKAVISQTIFTAMATTHGGGRDRLRADYDTNGWPQAARKEALKIIRKAFAVHIAGDQHLPAVVQYGIDKYRDAPVAFAGPAVNVGYPRWFEPDEVGQNPPPGGGKYTGDFIDHFGNYMTVLALKNGKAKTRNTLMERLADRASGLGIVRFDKKQRTITFECWPLLAEKLTAETQFPGWPVTVSQKDNFPKAAAARMPRIKLHGTTNAVVRVYNEKTGELEYALRVPGSVLDLTVSDAESQYRVEVSGHADAAASPRMLEHLSASDLGEREIRFS